jgi:hypothetical protein
VREDPREATERFGQQCLENFVTDAWFYQINVNERYNNHVAKLNLRV